ncbi:low molecular weight phosphatase family protein [Streptomyces sp. NBC_00237]|uniref:arsenate-mycothiol transferase ArsC n=1 Tax=Streptomyces sp. NBC_00237 TaxID=2975687 RepID=UPI00225AF064|nr:low molecular weight phosphatase family protein [Streptomyces sp. NBC_00237]MCX5200261.1 low molecular weight phosphatase family protein [Streptomyces sp. NBC_00237]
MEAPTAPFTVLFVCTGNVHRSVLAERLLARHAGRGVRVFSAGTRPPGPYPMDPATRAVLERRGGDGRDFASRRLTAALVAEASLVLGMEREHREAAVRLRPVALRRIFTLREFLRLAEGASGEPGEVVAHAAGMRGEAVPVDAEQDAVSDPWGRGPEALSACGALLDVHIAALAALLTQRPVRGTGPEPTSLTS